nr:hypothetical protein GCM10010200_083020 [Actinomadura rugatobispora]
MQERPPPAVVVPEGQLRVLVAPMGAGKSERAARCWQEGLEVAADDERAEIPVWLEARALTRAVRLRDPPVRGRGRGPRGPGAGPRGALSKG